MIKVTSTKTNDEITGVQAEMSGTGMEILKEYRGVVIAMHKMLVTQISKEVAKEMLLKITTEVIEEDADEDTENYNR